MYSHTSEADSTLCSYMVHAAADVAHTIRNLSNDTDIFVLLAYWISRMRVVANILMEKWNGYVLDVSKTIEQLCPRKCSQLIGLHTLSGCDTVSYQFGKAKKSAVKLLEIYQDLITCSDNLTRPTLSSRLQQTASFYPSIDRRAVGLRQIFIRVGIL